MIPGLYSEGFAHLMYGVLNKARRKANPLTFKGKSEMASDQKPDQYNNLNTIVTWSLSRQLNLVQFHLQDG